MKHSVIDEIRIDMKMIKDKDLPDIQVIHDKVNHALNDARYWRKNANPTKLSEAESRYKAFAAELVDMKNRLLEVKEEKYPEYVSNWVRAQLEFYRRCLEIAQHLDGQLRTIGPVPLSQLRPLDTSLIDLGSGDIGNEAEGEHSPSPSPSPSQGSIQPAGGYGAPPPVNRGPPPAVPASSARARANYAFTAGSQEELSFNAGEILTIHQRNGDWWMAELNGRRGLIPSNYVALI